MVNTYKDVSSFNYRIQQISHGSFLHVTPIGQLGLRRLNPLYQASPCPMVYMKTIFLGNLCGSSVLVAGSKGFFHSLLFFYKNTSHISEVF